MEGIIKAICISEQKGTEKHPVQDIDIIYYLMKSVKNLKLKELM